uniref:Uncharacterized protein n=1 Tax=viral metagenome TaxID=1070528 RepID=A0A6C0HEQ1_9ZZZZ
MSFSGIISKNLDNPIVMLIDYTESTFQVKSKYMKISSMKHYTIVNQNKTTYVLYDGNIPKDIFNFDINEVIKKLNGKKYCIAIIQCIDDSPTDVYLLLDKSNTYKLSYHIDKEKILFTTYNGYEELPEGYYIKVTLNKEIEVEKYMFSICE